MASSPDILSTPCDATPVRFTRLDWVFLGFVLFVPVIPNLIYLGTVPPRSFWLGEFVTSSLLVLSPLLLGVRPRVAVVLLIPFAALTPFVSAYAIATGYPPSLLILQILREASREELYTFIVPLMVCSGIAVGIAIAYWRVAARWAHQPVPLGYRYRAGGLVLLVAVLAKDIPGNGIAPGAVILLSRLEKAHPTAVPVLTLQLQFGQNVIADRTAVLQHAAINRLAPFEAREICVLVVGESARKRAFGLYNPQLATNPLLGQRELILFRDAVSCGTATIQSVPILLTGQLPDQGQLLPYRHLGLVEIFRLAGFQTKWIATHEADGQISSFITPFSANAQERIFLNGRMERSKFRNPELKNDGALLAPLARAIRDEPGPLFVALHTLGGHMPYLRRYPPEFEKWPVDPKAREDMWRWVPPFDQHQREQIDRAYLNTVLYTDWFLDQVIATLSATGGVSSMIYLSDHGETDAAASVMPAGHAVLSDDVVNIPMFIWLSPQFRQVRPEIAAALAANAEKRVSAQDIFATVCSLHALAVPDADPARSLAMPTYREHPRKVMLLDCQIVTLP